MSVMKSKNSKIESYQFGQLSPTQGTDGEVKAFKFETLDQAEKFRTTISQEKIREEREAEASSQFSISSIVKEHRGLNAQAESDFEERVRREVESRVEILGKEAYAQGLEEGRTAGHAEAVAAGNIQTEEKMDELTEVISNLQARTQEIYDESKNDAFLMVKNLTKWVILKEVDEKYYLVRLLEKLIHEINTKSNLVVRVNESALGHMSEVVKIVERKLGKLTNVRIELDLDQDGNGIILESENTVIDGSLETQFNAIDKLFENAGVNE